MFVRVLFTGYGDKPQNNVRASLEHEVTMMLKNIEVSAMGDRRATGYEGRLGLLYSEKSVVRKWEYDSNTSPSPVGRISKDKPTKNIRQWDCDEVIVTDPIGWTIIGMRTPPTNNSEFSKGFGRDGKCSALIALEILGEYLPYVKYLPRTKRILKVS